MVTSNTKYLFFLGNGALHGGAYYGTNSTLHLGSYKFELADLSSSKLGGSSNVFACNRAIRGGGALSSIGSNTTFGGTAIHFFSNSARNAGGGVYIGDTSQLLITAEEVNNSAQYSGGGGSCV